MAEPIKQLQVILEEQDVAKDNAKQLIEAFGAPFEEAGAILASYESIVVTKEDQFDLMADAREQRLKLKSIRVGVENKRKELKEESLKTGRAIDSVAKFVKEIIEPAEKYLEQQEKFGEIKAAERAAKLKAERIEKLMQFTDDISVYNLDDMLTEQFDTLLADLKKQHEARVAEAKRIEDERIAKEKADEKAREEQAKENERLKKEAAAKDEAQAKIRSRINRLTQLGMIFIESDQKYAVDDKIWIKQDDVENLDDESFESEYQARQKLVDERNANIKAEAKKMKEELDAANAKAAAEAAAKKVAEEEERKALLAPDKDKLVQFARAISIIQHEKLPAVKTKQAQDILNEVESKLSQLFNFIMDKSKEL